MNKLSETLVHELQKLDEYEQAALVLILKAHEHAKQKHPEFSKGDLMYGSAIVNEEAGELVRATINHLHFDGDPMEMTKEAAQTGATTIRMIALLDLKFPHHDVEEDSKEGEEIKLRDIDRG
jgi:hypothetical protein